MPKKQNHDPYTTCGPPALHVLSRSEPLFLPLGSASGSGVRGEVQATPAPQHRISAALCHWQGATARCPSQSRTDHLIHTMARWPLERKGCGAGCEMTRLWARAILRSRNHGRVGWPRPGKHGMSTRGIEEGRRKQYEGAMKSLCSIS